MRQFRGLTKNIFLDKLREDGKQTRRWVYGCHVEVEGKHYILTDDAQVVDTGPVGIEVTGFVEVIPETVGQSIGKKDKNKKEVYDGDKFYLPGKEYRVEWNGISANWILHPTKYNDAQLLNINYVNESVIIGNIHEDPKL